MSQTGNDDMQLSSVVVGSPNNFWIWSRKFGWDLTHPATPDAPPIQPRLCLRCEISNITIDPMKTALVIIDMHNYSMSCAPNVNPAVFRAQDMLLKYAIPAARKAGIQIIWLNWGLTEEDLKTIPPGAMRVLGWEANCDAIDYGLSIRSLSPDGTSEMISCGEHPVFRGPGADLGEVMLEDGTSLDAGRALMRGTWNAELNGPLLSAFEESQGTTRPDVRIHKDRNSGLYSSSCDCSIFLTRSGIRTLLFAGMNTDQCVMSTLQDAHCRGYDTVLVKDACATDSPRYAQENAEFNCCRNLGFLTTCESLAQAADLI
ncbi:isochorismatase family protein [Lojkania enalia]|uniref:Isochorismatase family protein n=1 Tax=Lojkania enalia TaxID=147567 RepID=A0A9P4K0U4_9PLEO|nr:isochorismatase family protein [Didymosphaeria enalia]